VGASNATFPACAANSTRDWPAKASVCSVLVQLFGDGYMRYDKAWPQLQRLDKVLLNDIPLITLLVSGRPFHYALLQTPASICLK
jgi:hypothetical protein